MQHSKLLDTFLGLVNRYAQHQQYIERARALAKKYRPSVVERVVSDHAARAKSVAREVEPHVDDMKRAISSLASQQRAAGDATAKQQTALEELELRLTIGELEQDAFDDEAAGIQKELQRSQAEFDGLAQEHSALSAALQRWKEFQGSAGSAPAAERERPSTGRPKPAPAPVVEAMEDIEAVEPIEEGPSGGVPAAAEAEDIGWSEVEDGGGEEAGWEDENIRARPTIPAGSKGPRARLLYQEGTAEEQTYPIHTEMITIGRGRNNDIQVKNDSKVSRVHCKLFERSTQFFIEDNKSSNGTLVNGELITERRLFGGEELIIGETFFRFQLP